MDIIELLTPEFLNSLRKLGLPGHHIKLKIGTPIILMRNLDQIKGLCNGTRLIVTNMANHVLEARIMGGKGHGNLISIIYSNLSWLSFSIYMLYLLICQLSFQVFLTMFYMEKHIINNHTVIKQILYYP